MNQKLGKKYVGKRLFNRIIISLVILLFIIGTVIYDLLLGEINDVILPIVSIALGTVLGLLIFDRIFKIIWQPKTQKIESRFDKTGIVFLIIYIVIVLVGREWLFPYLINGALVYVVSLGFTAGLLFGRILVLIKDIRKVLVQENKLSFY